MPLLRRLLPALALLSTAACVDTAVPHYQAPVEYQALKPYALNISDAALINNSAPNALTQEFSNKFGAGFESALNEWLQNRILVSGPQGTLLLTIRDANFEATKLQTEKTGVEGYFTREQIARWSANLEVSIAIKDNSSTQSPAEITITVSANRTVPEKASDEEKSRIYRSLLNDLMTHFNQEADAQIKTYFQPYLL